MARFRIDFFNAVDEIAAPVEAVFAAFQEVERWPSWASGIPRAWRRAPEQWRVGLRLGFVPRFLHLPVEVKVLEYEEHRRIAWGVRAPLFAMVHAFSFEPAPGGRCRVHHTEHAEGPLAHVTRPLAGQIARFDRRLSDDLAARFARA